MDEELNTLEKAVLARICCSAPSENVAELLSQLQKAKVARRENTGFGFFTTIDTEESSPLDFTTIGNVWAKIEGFNNMMTFVLFLRGGKMHLLEGASIDDRTTQIDFSKIKFELMDETT